LPGVSKPGPVSGKLKFSLTALSSAAVVAIYSAGFMRTRAAAEKFAGDELPKGTSGPVAPGSQVARSGGPGPQLSAARPATPVTIAPAPSPTSSSGPVAVAKPVQDRPALTAVAVIKPDAAPAATPAPAATTEAAPVVERPAVVEPVVTAPAAVPVPAPVIAAAAAAVSAAPAAPGAPAAPPKFKDGTFTGWGTSRHGDIEAQVVISSGRIQTAVITQCWTRWSCSVIAPLPPQVPVRQSGEVDFVSGATDSTYAFYYALVEALKKAK
jgi:uncharacterized protein with FMN-binding domain